MEKKKTKLTLSINTKKSIENINLAKTQGKNSVVIEKKTNKFQGKGFFDKKKTGYTFEKKDKFKSNKFPGQRFRNNQVKITPPSNDYEKRKLAEQRATKRLKEETAKEFKGKTSKKREQKLTVSRALSDKIETRARSLASLKRAKLKENRSKEELKENLKPVKRDVNIPEAITVRELANRMAEQSSSVIKHLFSMGVNVTINQTLAADTAEYLVKEFGHNPIRETKAEEIIQKIKDSRAENLKNRPPIVTVMGHVDHGKTSLLDSLRDTNVVSGEHGGITQHIGAYQVKTGGNKIITFIDTPGHAAFTEMRARGSKITDIVVLVVAADDGIKPQTVEAIKHAKAAKVPIIVAINKCDLPEKNISKIKNEMMQYELIAEDLSGDTLFVEVSALKKMNLNKLKESILLQSEILDLKASYSDKARGVVIESKIDKGKGPVSTILISNGKLRTGDYFICGDTWGKIRAMINYEGKMLNEALPSMPVEILGMNSSAYAGAEFTVTNDENEAKELTEFRKNNTAQNKNLTKEKTTLFENAKGKDELNIIIKSDVQGSSEALKMAINKIEHSEVEAKIILSDIGMINETDVSLAKASNAVLIGFNIKPNREAKKLAEEQKIDIRYFNIIYEAIDHVEKSLSGLLEPDVKETVLGSAEIQKVFKVSTAGKIAGSKVTSGEIKSKSKARIIRDGVVVFTGEINSIFREKDQVKEVGAGLECGISIKDFIDFKEKDVIESYLSEEIQRSI